MHPPSPMPAGPLSRRFDAATARQGGTPVRVETTPTERAALARDCDIPGIDALEADLDVFPDGADGLRVTGTVTARIRQVCVVSLEEFASAVDEAVDVRFAPRAEVEALAAARAAGGPSSDDEEVEDLPDPMVGGRIDIGALVAEILVLGLDPYPRKPGVVFAEPAPLESEEAPVSPFSVLRPADRPDGG